jgi:hypothetical protein
MLFGHTVYHTTLYTIKAIVSSAAFPGKYTLPSLVFIS